MRFKVGCRLSGLQPQAVLALVVCNEVFRDHGEPMTVTSVNDGSHMVGSYHFKGLAFDIRTKSIESNREAVVEEISHRLAPLGYDVIFESVGHPSEHLHVEYDPK